MSSTAPNLLESTSRRADRHLATLPSRSLQVDQEAPFHTAPRGQEHWREQQRESYPATHLRLLPFNIYYSARETHNCVQRAWLS